MALREQRIELRPAGFLDPEESVRALQFAREAVQRALDVPLHEGLRTEADLSTLAYRTRDAEEGMQAFVEKRKPQFRDE